MKFEEFLLGATSGEYITYPVEGTLNLVGDIYENTKLALEVNEKIRIMYNAGENLQLNVKGKLYQVKLLSIEDGMLTFEME